jgi:hypothetical protein
MCELIVYCPSCDAECGVNLEERDLVEGCTTEGMECECASCGRAFIFDVYVDLLNKHCV